MPIKTVVKTLRERDGKGGSTETAIQVEVAVLPLSTYEDDDLLLAFLRELDVTFANVGKLMPKADDPKETERVKVPFGYAALCQGLDLKARDAIRQNVASPATVAQAAREDWLMDNLSSAIGQDFRKATKGLSGKARTTAESAWWKANMEAVDKAMAPPAPAPAGDPPQSEPPKAQ